MADIKRDFFKLASDVLAEANEVLAEAQDEGIPALISTLETNLTAAVQSLDAALARGQERVLDLKEKVDSKLN